MCTLTYIPTSNGFVLTHNRDENLLRELALPPFQHRYHDIEITYPKDGKAGGTWIAATSNRVICLLNGAFTNHKHHPPYRKSRGIVMLDIFLFSDISSFHNKYDLEGIEPFTAIEIQQSILTEFRWDGVKGHINKLKNEPNIWSSATLYAPEIQEKRRALFNAFLSHCPVPTTLDIYLFHLTGKIENAESSLVMEKPNGVKTLSISQISSHSEKTHFLYLDLIKQHLQLL